MTVEVKKDRVAEVMAAVRALTTKEVLVGIPDTDAPRTEEEAEAKKGEPINNATIGYINEFGSPAANIPERPHLRPGVEDVRDRIANKLVQGAKKALDGDKEAGAKALEAVGLIAQSAVRKKIEAGPFTPLAPATLANRRARGRTGEKPLQDTGQYRNSITYVVAPKETKR